MDKAEQARGKVLEFGDLALSSDQKSGLPRRATVIATKDSHFAVLSREIYDVHFVNISL